MKYANSPNNFGKNLLLACYILFSVLFFSTVLTITKHSLMAETWAFCSDAEFNATLNSDGYYHIRTPQQLARGISKLNVKMKLINNISLSGKQWRPITSYNLFTGEIDGNGCVIANLTITDSSLSRIPPGLIPWTGSGAVIKNLTLKDVKITLYNSTSDFTGSFVGEVNTGKTTISNCYATGEITVSGNTYKYDNQIAFGGLVGRTSNGTVSITNCTNYIDITVGAQIGSSADLYVGGLIGKMGTSSTLRYCTNFGTVKDVSSNTAQNANFGGIAGEAKSEIRECANFGVVTVSSTDVGRSYVGGIAGYSSTTLYACMNRANVTAQAKSTTTTTSVSQSSGSEQISAVVNKNLLGTPVTLTGYNYDRNGDNLGSCYNQVTQTLAYAGGIVGYTIGTVSYSYNTGTISGGVEGTVKRRMCSTRYMYDTWPAGFKEYHPLYQTAAYNSKIYFSGINGYRSATNTTCYSLSNNINFSVLTSYIFPKGYNMFTVGFVGVSTESGTICPTVSYSQQTTSPLTLKTGYYYYTTRSGGNYTSTAYLIQETVTVSTNYNVTSATSLKSTDISSLYIIRSDINGGYPILKNLYWLPSA